MKPGKNPAWKALSVGVALLLALAIPAGAAPALAKGADKQAPTKPAGLTASGVGETSLTLNWRASRDNVAMSGYRVYKNGAYLGAAKKTGFTVKGLLAGKTYSFYVKARDKAGNLSARSATVKVKTQAALAKVSAKTASKTAAAPAQKIVAGYYASWSSYNGYTPRDIQAGNLTHILYAFANIDGSYRITLGDTEADPANLAELKALKQKYPKLKTLISVGGWEWSGKFSDLASSPARRSTFASSVSAFVKKYGLDGVDIDWEYPVAGGKAGNSASPADKSNFTLLLRDLRAALDKQGKADGKAYLVTIAGGAGTDYIGNVQLPSIAKYVNFATVMTYDIHGPYDSYTDHNAPLYPASGSPQQVWSADQSVKAWVAAGFPKAKLVMGVPFYGHLYSGVTGGGSGLYKPFTDMKSVSYDQIVKSYLSNSVYKRTYAAEGKTPWLFNGSNFITYEDAKSIASKTSYIKSSGIAGAGVWDLGENADGTLLKALYKGLK